MTTRKDFPSGYRATYRGATFHAGGGHDGNLTLWDPDTSAEAHTVPIEELDEWYGIRVIGTYLDEPFKVEAEIGSQYWITFIGGNGSKIADEWKARANDEGARYWQEDQNTFMARVPKSEVHNVHEERQDALGPWLAAQEKR